MTDLAVVGAFLVGCIAGGIAGRLLMEFELKIRDLQERLEREEAHLDAR